MSKRGIVVIVFVVMALVVSVVLYLKRNERLSFDKDGFPHGTGEHVYTYPNGAVKLREEYVQGEVTHGIWYSPTGAVVWESTLADGNGEWVYLRDDGTIRLKLNFVNGEAEGEGTYFDEQGNVEKVVEFKNGAEVEGNETRPESELVTQ